MDHPGRAHPRHRGHQLRPVTRGSRPCGSQLDRPGQLARPAAQPVPLGQEDDAAGGLAGANGSGLNGADGLGEIAAGLVSQGLTILESVRRSVGGPATEPSSSNGSGNGTTPRRLPAAPTAPAGPDDRAPGRAN